MSPFHRNTPQSELIRLIQALGRMKAEHQNVVIPEITVLINNSRPAKDNAFELHDENLLLICCSSHSQFNRDIFFVQRGTLR